MIDVHTHLNDEKLFAISEQIVAKLVQNGISKVIVPSCDKNLLDASDDEIKGLEKLPETLEEALEIAKKSDFVKSIINANTLDSFFRSLEEDIVDYYDPNKNFKRWITF